MKRIKAMMIMLVLITAIFGTAFTAGAFHISTDTTGGKKDDEHFST